MTAQAEIERLPPVIHVGRNPPLIVLKDRDVMAFMPHTVGQYAYSFDNTTCDNPHESGCVVDASGHLLKLWKREQDSTGSPVYAMTKYPDPLERTLLWYRITTEGKVKNTPRFVCYINGVHPDTADIVPFYEVINPNVVYERDSNTLTMLYWTNLKAPPTIGEPISESQILKINESDFDQSVEPYKDACKVLALAHGSIQHMYAEEGFAFPPDEWPSGPDLIPLFQQPIAIDYWDLRQDDLDQDSSYTNDGYVPILDFIRGGGGGGGGGCQGLYETPKDLTFPGGHADAGRGSDAAWNRESENDSPPNYEGVKVTIMVGISYNPAGAIKAWYQDFLFDHCGSLVSIGEEREAELDRPVDC